MDAKAAIARVKKLREEINFHNHLYYVESRTEITDFDFDQLMNELIALENTYPELADENSPSKRVGGDITKKLETVKHQYPMLSLSNSYSKEEIIEWEQRLKKVLVEKFSMFAS